MVPEADTRGDKVFEMLDKVFTGLFAVELCVSFVAHAFFLFFKDAWRIFDTLIVFVGIVAAVGARIPGVNAIRAIRVLRALRLLKKSKSLKPIVGALLASVMPVLNAMVLLVDYMQKRLLGLKWPILQP
jgi:voltage-gated sodium channel